MPGQTKRTPEKPEITIREFNTSFFFILKINPLFKTFLAYFLSNFMNLYVLFCTNCIVIDLIGGLLNVYQYYWQQRQQRCLYHPVLPQGKR